MNKVNTKLKLYTERNNSTTKLKLYSDLNRDLIDFENFEDDCKYVDSLRRSNLKIDQLKSFKDELEKIESLHEHKKSIFFDCCIESQYFDVLEKVDLELDDRVKSKIIDSFVREKLMYIKYLIKHSDEK
jgi:hypothetical protein